MEFDWLSENGRLWTPESKAFWLDPATEAEVVSWFRKYRPAFRGQVQCAGFNLTITDPPAPTLPIEEAYFQAYVLGYSKGKSRHNPAYIFS